MADTKWKVEQNEQTIQSGMQSDQRRAGGRSGGSGGAVEDVCERERLWSCGGCISCNKLGTVSLC